MEIYKIAIYPYSPEIDPILEHIFFLVPQYEIKSLISPKGWGYVGNDINLGKSNFGKKITVRPSVDEIDDDINCILIPEFDSTEQFESTVITNIETVLPQINRIICNAHLKKANLKKLREICANSSISCEFGIKNEIETKFDYYSKPRYETESHLEEISVPVIAVAGLFEKVDKFYTSLALRNMFINEGYKVSQIGARNYCEILGFHSFPEFMLSPEIDETKKIILFNRYVKQICDDERPDVVIIGIPGAIQSYNATITNHFGILHYMVSKSVIIDFLVVCTSVMTDESELLKLISQSCLYKFGCAVDCFHMSNLLIDDSSAHEGNLSYSNLPRQNVDKIITEYYKESDVPVINVYNIDEAARLYDKIINKLHGD